MIMMQHYIIIRLIVVNQLNQKVHQPEECHLIVGNLNQVNQEKYIIHINK